MPALRSSQWAGDVAVIGLGTMGAGIAFVLAQSGSRVRVSDASPHSTRRGLDDLKRRIGGYVDTGMMDETALDALVRIVPADSLTAAVAGAGLVVEAVFEDWGVKQATLEQISAATSKDTVIASNTSSFPIDRLAAFVKSPSRFLGVHFFNPAEWIPGVEVIPGEATDESVVSRAIVLLQRAGKAPIRVRSSPGFVANRLQFALLAEALRCLDEGVATVDEIDTVVRSTFGFRLAAFGPFAIADMAGLDVCVSILKTLEDGFGDRFAAPETLTALVERGDLGVKTGCGFRRHRPEESDGLVTRRAQVYSSMARLRIDNLPIENDRSEWAG